MKLQKRYFEVLLLVILGASIFSFANAVNRETFGLDILRHEWHPKTVWERIGKTQFIWKATVINRSDMQKRVFVYYSLLDDHHRPLSRNVADKVINAHQTVEIVGDSYINTAFLPRVKNSDATLRVGFPE
jgi:hypothetical protein